MSAKVESSFADAASLALVDDDDEDGAAEASRPVLDTKPVEDTQLVGALT